MTGQSPGFRLFILPVLHCQRTAGTYLGFKGSCLCAADWKVIQHLSAVQQTLTAPQTVSPPPPEDVPDRRD